MSERLDAVEYAGLCGSTDGNPILADRKRVSLFSEMLHVFRQLQRDAVAPGRLLMRDALHGQWKPGSRRKEFSCILSKSRGVLIYDDRCLR